MAKLENVIEVLGKLKDLKRSGWLRKEISESESVADHSFGVAFLVLLLAPAHLNKEKCLKMAVIHDIQEAIVGDMTPFDGACLEHKAEKEKAAVSELAQKLDYPELITLFEEYEAKETPEAQFVKDIDRIEAVLQAKYYDGNSRGLTALPEFCAYAQKHLCSKDKIFAEILDKIE